MGFRLNAMSKMHMREKKPINVINVILKPFVDLISTPIRRYMDSLAMSVTRNSLTLMVFLNTNEKFIERN